MLCDNCTHSDVCRYFSEYVKFHKTLKEAFEIRTNANEFKNEIPFRLPDLECAYYQLVKTEIKRTPLELAHRDDPGEPGEQGFNAGSIPPPSSLNSCDQFISNSSCYQSPGYCNCRFEE